ncbi:MAG: helix-turn-helix domain-containing protein, partial [Steroidobacteraceae bacterium]
METVTRGYRIRAYPNAAQRRMLDRWFGATRWVWNHALEIR